MISQGNFLVNSKWQQITRGIISHIQRYRTYAPGMSDQDIVAWIFAFQLAAELCEASDIFEVDAISQLKMEIRKALLDHGLGTGHIDSIFNLSEQATRENNPYHFIAAFSKSIFSNKGKPPSLEFQLTSEMQSDSTIKTIEVDLFSSTQIARFIDRNFIYSDEWSPLLIFLDYSVPTNNKSAEGTLAIQLVTNPSLSNDGTGIVRSWFLAGIAVGRNCWVLRPKSKKNSLRDCLMNQLAQRTRRRNVMLFNAMEYGNLELVTGDDPVPDTSSKLPSDKFHASWSRIQSCIRPGDFLFSRDTSD